MESEGRLGPAKGKSFDGGNVLGPWIVTPDEIGDPQALSAEVRVNGEIRSRGERGACCFRSRRFSFYASQDETIHAGEFFGSGTVGNCCGLEIGRFLENGDVDRTGGREDRRVAQQGRTTGLKAWRSETRRNAWRVG